MLVVHRSLYHRVWEGGRKVCHARSERAGTLSPHKSFFCQGRCTGWHGRLQVTLNREVMAVCIKAHPCLPRKVTNSVTGVQWLPLIKCASHSAYTSMAEPTLVMGHTNRDCILRLFEEKEKSFLTSCLSGSISCAALLHGMESRLAMWRPNWGNACQILFELTGVHCHRHPYLDIYKYINIWWDQLVVQISELWGTN